ncbi:hypothetical protein XENTR_v10002093 [Xenopus tropicalis]|uniref:Fc receptor-like protein 5 n=1 Tax=Xenopus tropicalis TaxID=8364 RepID=A0A803KAY6_XENTR|nr:Fc receptor-like protein 5 [Xenopus tropicalis]XP_012826753.2 Fc receptor-like protein 5 [Xenopus tropicalis]XP_031747275.1 Fc receptor-like protein 5 [Xenopus tropicalis]KAE8633786.1 hypothetical protein XENTR_v10002093 [Xenopus tropicalis]KAE8633787.1 hypothetical protein XENTR_v10002093 [Xenopus tropicalis]KAE8633788.1 hypothetical protein XENTR_v10002093 [Xenopus tropicalis]KAE8633789.1 hypothetical protein XENTR_v10002093 [Xenopus tropicalis]
MHSSSLWSFCILLRVLETVKLYEASLQMPYISFSAGYATYLIAEPVSMSCQIPSNITVNGYQFFKNHQKIQDINGPLGKHHKITSVNRGSAGSYSCLYWIEDSRGKQISPKSPPVSLSVMDQPTTPVLDIDPKYPLYFEGEDVHLECRHHIYPYTGGYKFYKNNRELNISSGNLASTFSIYNISRKDSGTYKCEYWLSEHQRVVYSPRSKPQTLSVTALSTSPLLLFQPPYSTFIVGETVSMECLAPSTVPVSLYRFYYEEREVVSPSTTHSGQHSLRNLTKKHKGNYICMYWSTKSQREIPSFPSVTKELYIIDPLQSPVLAVDPPSGRIWDGANVTLICTTPIPYENTTFHFLNDREAVFSNNTSRAQMKMVITMSMLNATSVFKYSCQYTAYIKGRALTSPRSHPAEITIITGSVNWLIAIAVAAGVVVLITVFLLLYWICLARRGSADDGEKSQSSEEDGKITTGLRMKQRSPKN